MAVARHGQHRVGRQPAAHLQEAPQHRRGEALPVRQLLAYKKVVGRIGVGRVVDQQGGRHAHAPARPRRGSRQSRRIIRAPRRRPSRRHTPCASRARRRTSRPAAQSGGKTAWSISYRSSITCGSPSRPMTETYMRSSSSPYTSARPSMKIRWSRSVLADVAAPLVAVEDALTRLVGVHPRHGARGQAARDLCCLCRRVDAQPARRPMPEHHQQPDQDAIHGAQPAAPRSGEAREDRRERAADRRRGR